ncbi:MULTISPECIES: CRISPR-associated protein Cas4 [Nitrosomonas]|uniref:CRISPR-associated exonuclease Cas4 n=1 Tax=Nitrosomonas communis TaxID=44574 RepID=A0A1H2PZ94_9PROT|nr:MULTISPECIES: CRISPR-associated protein Cas4 [Nitrosomonas]TYP91902.1 CRISPR-associated exonuclease Cas4 [Nitrosomonas communis]UVS61014.1 CRISPR-associated protein Cas4 [Nitrosomonas sp. PLL12]SDW00215.1 CRISPR-associated exonuclease Cas4 [Nitrosomonas communis]
MDVAEIDDPIMLSALQHYSYCPRQCALIHIEQAFDENVHTMRGNAVHERVDEPGLGSFEGVRTEYALPVWSEKLGLIGKCDVVEFYPDGRIYPVEYKHGKKRAKAHDDIQLAAQAICLEEMTGKAVMHGAIYHHSSRRRREVAITTSLRQQVEETVKAVRALLASGKLPPPVNDARCKECSLKEICQPEALTNKARQRKMHVELFELDQ